MHFVEWQRGRNYICVGRRSPGPQEGSLRDIMPGLVSMILLLISVVLFFDHFLPSDQVQHKYIVVDS